MDYEYQFNENLSKQDSTNTLPNVKGRLKEHVSFWIETIKVPEFIVDCIREGYKIPFTRLQNLLRLRITFQRYLMVNLSPALCQNYC